MLVPLEELAPDFPHPLLGRTVRQLRAVVENTEGVRLWGPPPCLEEAQGS